MENVIDYSSVLADIVECLRAIIFMIGFASGLVFMGLFGKRWFF